MWSATPPPPKTKNTQKNEQNHTNKKPTAKPTSYTHKIQGTRYTHCPCHLQHIEFPLLFYTIMDTKDGFDFI